MNWFKIASLKNGFEKFKQSIGGKTPKDLILSVIKSTPLGSGRNASAYDIPGTDFVARVIKRNTEEIEKSLDGVSFQQVPDDHPDMNVGQAVASAGPFVAILHKQTGMPLGFNPQGGNAYKDKLELHVAQFKKKLEDAAAMPQSAYDQLMSEIEKLNSRGYKIDPSKSNNLLIDTSRGRFGIVDIAKGDYKSGAADVLNMIANYYYLSKYLYDDQEAIRSLNKIISKLAKYGIDNSGSVEAIMNIASGKYKPYQPTEPQPASQPHSNPWAIKF